MRKWEVELTRSFFFFYRSPNLQLIYKFISSMEDLMSWISDEGQWDSVVCLGQGAQDKVKVKEVQ